VIHLNAPSLVLETAVGTVRYQSESLKIVQTAPEGDFFFLYDDGTQFVIRADGRQVLGRRPQGATSADMAMYLRGPVLGMILRLRGIVCLHSSVVAFGTAAIAIVGAGGSGKSTTAAGFVRQGHSALADDVGALIARGGRFYVLPAFPRLQLWPDSAVLVSNAGTELPRLTPQYGIYHDWDKRFLDLAIEQRFHPDPLPLAGIYILTDRDSDPKAPRIEPLSSQQAFLELTGETYLNYALDESMRALEFSTIGQLVRTVRIRRVTPHCDPARLPALCDAIRSDYLASGLCQAA
jgi:hypothetical protein